MIIACSSGKKAIRFAQAREDAVFLRQGEASLDQFVLLVSNELHQHRYVLLNTNQKTLSALRDLRIDYILLYTAADAASFCKDRIGHPLVLQSGEEIVDRIRDLDQIIDAEEARLSIHVGADVRKRFDWIFACTGLSIEEYCRRSMMWLVDHPEETERYSLLLSNKYHQLTETELELETLSSGKMTEPNKEKLDRYEEYFRRTGLFAHDVVVNEEREIEDGYITYLLAEKFHIEPRILMCEGKQEVYKLVSGPHVKKAGGEFIPVSSPKYTWIYRKKEAVVPGDILIVDTRFGDQLMQVERIRYLAGENVGTDFKRVKRHYEEAGNHNTERCCADGA